MKILKLYIYRKVFCGRIYGSQRKKRTKQIIEELKEECKNDKK